MELLPTSQRKSNESSSRRFKRSSSMPLILTRLTKFPQMDFEVRSFPLKSQEEEKRLIRSLIVCTMANGIFTHITEKSVSGFILLYKQNNA